MAFHRKVSAHDTRTSAPDVPTASTANAHASSEYDATDAPPTFQQRMDSSRRRPRRLYGKFTDSIPRLCNV